MCQISRVLYRVGQSCFAHRRLVVLAWLVVLLAAVFAIQYMPGTTDSR
jgi:hypothetical protein